MGDYSADYDDRGLVIALGDYDYFAGGIRTQAQTWPKTRHIDKPDVDTFGAATAVVQALIA